MIDYHYLTVMMTEAFEVAYLAEVVVLNETFDYKFRAKTSFFRNTKSIIE